MSVQRACDVCSFYRQRVDGTPGVARYILSTSSPEKNIVTRLAMSTRDRAPNGEVRSYGAGSIDLCDECWTRIAKPRMQATRGKHRRVPQA
jgi:hypothetical protein